MDFITWLVLGALAGWIATIITRTNERVNWLGNIIVGIIGAFIGGLVLRLLGFSTSSGLNIPSLLTAIFGAVILLSVMRGFRHNKTV